MAYMTVSNRRKVWAGAMEGGDFGGLSLTKADLLEAVNALDVFLEDNRAAVNSAIPLPARTQLNTNQKIKLLKFVLDLRLSEGVDV